MLWSCECTVKTCCDTLQADLSHSNLSAKEGEAQAGDSYLCHGRGKVAYQDIIKAVSKNMVTGLILNKCALDMRVIEALHVGLFRGFMYFPCGTPAQLRLGVS